MITGSSVLVTGASGFVGRALCQELAARGHLVHAAVRSLSPPLGFTSSNIRPLAIGNLDADTDWREVLRDFAKGREDLLSCIIHCAARAHIMRDATDDVISAYRDNNVGVTRQLAKHAAQAGIKRLVFLSSIKVNGGRTEVGQPFRYDDQPKPEDAYGRSKLEAEEALWAVAKSSDLEVTVVRPPLVYGPGVKGNLLKLMALVSRGLPLPLGSISNRRAMVGIDNLVDLLIACVQPPKAAGQTFLVSDDEDLSTPDLLRNLAEHMNLRTRLFPAPVPLLKLLGRVIGKQAEIARLTESLQVDCSHTHQVLGWKPPVPAQHGLKKMVDWYLSHDRGAVRS